MGPEDAVFRPPVFSKIGLSRATGYPPGVVFWKKKTPARGLACKQKTKLPSGGKTAGLPVPSNTEKTTILGTWFHTPLPPTSFTGYKTLVHWALHPVQNQQNFLKYSIRAQTEKSRNRLRKQSLESLSLNPSFSHPNSIPPCTETEMLENRTNSSESSFAITHLFPSGPSIGNCHGPPIS